MHILITGGTGFIGKNLIHDDLFAKVTFTVLTRNKRSSSDLASSRCRMVESLDEIENNHKIDAVINLAGAQIVGKRWSENRKREIRHSRIDLTRNLVAWMQRQETPPSVLLSGSAIGYYGNTGDVSISETHGPSTDFGALLCIDWEAEALKAEEFGTRVCLLRTGLVFGKKGGMLEQMILPFRLYLGSQIGNGQQWMSWIHIHDQIKIIHHLLHRPESRGPYNLVSPDPVTNRTFTKTLAHALGRISLLSAPAFVIKLALGEAACLLLGGQKVYPERIEQEGFEFLYLRIEDALKEVTAK